MGTDKCAKLSSWLIWLAGIFAIIGVILKVMDYSTQNVANLRGRMRHGTRQCTLSYTVEMEDGSTELTDMLAGTEGSANIIVVGAALGVAYHTLEITIPRLILRAAPIGDTDGLITVAVEAEILKDPSEDVVTFEVTTGQDEIGTAA